MPTYQYACRSCDHRFEQVQGFADATLTTCPNCGQEQLRKLFGNVGVVFKGSGFYRNDSRSNKTNTSGNSGKSTESTSSGSGGEKSGSDSSSTASKTDTSSTSSKSTKTSAKAASPSS